MKKILLLGGSYQQIAAIKAAKRLGFYTILCDYLLDNPGQFVADKYYPISTTDKEQILGIAKRERVDGILAYASDPAAPTAAMGEKFGEKMRDVIPFYATYNIHTASNGVYDGIEVSDAVKPYVVRICVYKKIGDIVEYFDNASKAIGIVFLKFSNQKVMIEMMERMSEMIKVKVK